MKGRKRALIEMLPEEKNARAKKVHSTALRRRKNLAQSQLVERKGPVVSQALSKSLQSVDVLTTSTLCYLRTTPASLRETDARRVRTSTWLV